MSQRNRPCSCGSGKRYKHCCGALGAASPAPLTGATAGSLYTLNGYFEERYRGEAMRQFLPGMPEGRSKTLPWTPPGLLIIEDFLNEATCQRWRETFDGQPTTPATVQDLSRKSSDGKPLYRLDEARVTEFVPLGELEPEIHRVLIKAYRDVIAPHFGAELDWMSQPAVLKYVPGGKYHVHSDNGFWDPLQQQWVKSMDRDYSLLLYVNDDFEGGTLFFPNFNLRFRPARGMLVAFPSDHRYMHTAESVLSGERYAVVCWGVVKGVPRIHAVPHDAIRPEASD